MSGAIYFDSGRPSNFDEGDFTVEVPGGYNRDPAPMPHFAIVGSVERYFQAMKAYRSSIEAKPTLFWNIMQAETSSIAKHMGRSVRFTSADKAMWDGVWAVEAMTHGCMMKFSQRQDCREWLIDTGDRMLVEHRRDPIWGDNLDGTGRNLLGLILMTVRARVRDDKQKGETNVADAITSPESGAKWY